MPTNHLRTWWVWLLYAIVAIFWALVTVIVAVLGPLVIGTVWLVVTIWEWVAAR